MLPNKIGESIKEGKEIAQSWNSCTHKHMVNYIFNSRFYIKKFKKFLLIILCTHYNITKLKKISKNLN